MGLAIRSAELAANALMSDLSPRPTAQRLRAEFDSLWRARSLTCRSAAILVSRPRLADVLIPMLGGCDALVNSALWLCGKQPAPQYETSMSF